MYPLTMRSYRGRTLGWNIEIYSTPTNQFDWSVSRAYVIGERSEPLSDQLGGEICIATRALVCIYICVRPDDRTVLTLYVACAARANWLWNPIQCLSGANKNDKKTDTAVCCLSWNGSFDAVPTFLPRRWNSHFLVVPIKKLNGG